MAAGVLNFAPAELERLAETYAFTPVSQKPEILLRLLETRTRFPGSPAKFVAAEKRTITGSPKRKHISTSFVERQNLTMRMSMKRFARLGNGFSKKAENHAYWVAIHFMHYNFVRIHQSLRVTPAMAAGVTTKLWSIADMVNVIEDRETLRDGTRLVGRLVG